MTVREPEDTHRTMILGRTGTGKSQFGLHLLSEQNWDHMPWVMIDYKGEDLIADILAQNGWRKVRKGKKVMLVRGMDSPIRELEFGDKIPRKAGLYYMNPRPIVDDDAVEAWLLRAHKQGNIGLFIDEGYAMPRFGSGPGFTMILTQGRSLHIPVICLYQRPVWMSRFAIAQADFISVFKQGDERDEKVTKNFCKPAVLPNGNKLGPMDLDKLPDYYSLWHDVGRGETAILKPAPDRRIILQTFKDRLSPRQQRNFV